MEVEGLPLDIISNLPSSMLQTILTSLPIRDAFKTSVLSRRWRYHCANIPRLEFNDELWRATGKLKLLLDIYTVLLLHHGPVIEFSLCISQLQSCCEIDQIILYLSRNTALKKFTLCMGLGNDHKLPSSFFELQNLTHLKLQRCAVHHLASFSRFGSLTSLCFYEVSISKSTLLRFLSCCPVIKNFSLIEDDVHFPEMGCSYFVDIFQYLPLIEHLEMNQCSVKVLNVGVIANKFTKALVHLKFLGLSGLSFAKEDELSSVLRLVASSQNIKKIQLKMCNYDPSKVVSQVAMNLIHLQDDSYITVNHLRELEITNFTGMKPEMDFVKVILAKSPMLEKVLLVFDQKIDFQKRFGVLKELLDLPRASSQAKISV